ncbi:MAG: FUSC family protein [Cellulosilyticum sp.]|nr:FUSC family protein [Cellulosilyticum sp.]
MNKKKIISTTILFLIIIISCVLFGAVFGQENSLVAVTGITAALSLMGTDYTINPVKNTIYFVCLEVIIGIASFLASLNAFLGLIITFGMVFYILYTFTYDNKKPIYVGFTLGYFFMLYSPVPLSGLPLRLVGLALWGLVIMLLQFVANKNAIQKRTHTQIKIALKNLQEEIALVEAEKDLDQLSELNHTTHTILRNLIETLYEYIDKGARLPISLFQELFIAHFLDSLNIQIKEMTQQKYDTNISSIKALSVLLNHMDLFLNDKENVDNLICALNNYSSACDYIKSKNFLDFELNTSITILKRDLINTTADDLSKFYSQYFVTNIVEKITSFKNNMSRDSSRFTFALRGAIITSIGVFIVGAFNIQEGKWIIFSLHAVVQPYLDFSKTKGYHRLIGTVIGLVIFEIVFSVFTDTASRSIIILIVGYLSNYQRNYAEQVICMTISALGAASIGTDIRTVGIERLVFVVLGTCIALYANKVILPYRVTDATKSDLNHAITFNKKIISSLYEKCLGINRSIKEVNVLINVNKFINRKIEYNNQLISSVEINNFIYNQHIFMNNVRIITNIFINVNPSHQEKLELQHIINDVMNDTLSKAEILKYIEQIDDRVIQVILINLLKVKENISDSASISEVVSQSI